jgi:transposase-like protein
LCAKRDSRAARRFFEKILSEPKNPIPRLINVDKNPAYAMAVEAMKREGVMPKRVKLRPVKYVSKDDVLEQNKFVENLFGLNA